MWPWLPLVRPTAGLTHARLTRQTLSVGDYLKFALSLLPRD